MPHVSLQLGLFLAVRSNPLVVGALRVTPEWLKTRIKETLLGYKLDGSHTSEQLLANGGVLIIPHDPYWLPYVRDVSHYEPEIRGTIDCFVKPDTLFIDAGANIGLWSVYAVGFIGEGGKVVAIEPGTIRNVLLQNQALNGHRFDVISNAVAETSGQVLTLHEYPNHVHSSLKGDLQTRAPIRELQVETITLDDIVERALIEKPGISRIVLKLDIEGFEREALAGMRRTLAQHDVLIVYEDQSRDKASETTRHVLDKLMLHVYYPGEQGNMWQIEDVSELDAIKANREEKGYNFIACKPGGEIDQALQRQCVETRAMARGVGNYPVGGHFNRNC